MEGRLPDRIVTDCYVKKELKRIKKGREADESDTARADFTHFAERPRQLTRTLLIRWWSKTKQEQRIVQS